MRLKNSGDEVLSGSFSWLLTLMLGLDKVGDQAYKPVEAKRQRTSGVEESKMVHAVNRLVQTGWDIDYSL